MASLNKVQILGNLGRDPEIKITPQGKKVATFSIATTEKYTDRSGQKHENTEWHNIVAWEKLADIIEKYVKKGSSVFIEGKLTTRSWDNAEGKKQYRTEIVAREMQMLGGKNDNQQEPQASTPFENQDDDLPF